MCDEIHEILGLLSDSTKLNRDKGESRLNELTIEDDVVSIFAHSILQYLKNAQKWQQIFAAMRAAKKLIESAPESALQTERFVDHFVATLPDYEEHVEYRVRLAVGEAIGAICERFGLAYFLKFVERVKRGICENLESTDRVQKTSNIIEKAKTQSSSLAILHDTAGWKSLETWMKSMQFIIDGLGMKKFSTYWDPELVDLIFAAVNHTNRFVRETGYDLIGTLARNCGCHSRPQVSSDQEQLIGPDYIRIASQLAKGLSDNWSQVRMAASKATRQLFEAPAPEPYTHASVYSILLPRICLNRFYLAEGVRIYNQETWVRITQGKGKELLEKILPETIEFYVDQTDADNHAVREAACSSIAEIGTKLDRDLLRPHFNGLVQALLVCFEDDSWPVRDAACVAIGNLISAFPEEGRLISPNLMADRFLKNLGDCIPSVRLAAAHSIAQVMRSAEDGALNKIYLDYIRQSLEEVKNQPSESHGAASERIDGQGPGVSHVVSEAAVHSAAHTDRQMFSCGSLAPKMRKGGRGGCHDGLFQRESDAWEKADGAIRLLGELAQVAPSIFPDNLVKSMIECCTYTHYPHHAYLHETSCNVIGKFASGLPKLHFKRHLDDLFAVLAQGASSDLFLARVATEEALKVIAKKVGRVVLEGRIKQHYEYSTLKILDSVLNRILPLQ